MKRAQVYGFLLIVALAAGGYFLNQKYHWIGGTAAAKTEDGKGGKDKKDAKDAIVVELSPAQRGSISTHVVSSGNVRALRDVEVAAQVDGVAVKVLVEEGDYVEKGQVLCQVDDTEFRIRQELAEAKLQQAKLQYEKALIRLEKNNAQTDNRRVEYDRYKRAHEQGLVPETDVAQRKYQLEEGVQDGRLAESEIKEFRHKVEELDAEIAQAKLSFSRAQIKAPSTGYVTRRMIDLGQRVRILEPVFSLGAFQPLFVDVFVSERESRLVRPGQPVQIRLGADGVEEKVGQVERIAPTVDQNSGTVKVTVRLDNAGKSFRPGAFVRAAIRTDTRTDAVLIPKKALVEEDGAYYVFLAKADTAKRVKVETGYESDAQVEIREGVPEGEKVVIAGQGALKEGSKIQTVK